MQKTNLSDQIDCVEIAPFYRLFFNNTFLDSTF